MPFWEHIREPGNNKYNHSGNLLRNRKALAAMFRDAYESEPVGPILLFGYPGAGKTSLYGSSLSDVLATTQQPREMDILRIGCNQLIRDCPEEQIALQELGKITQQYTTGELPNLRIMVLDEVDTIGLRRTAKLANHTLCEFVMAELEKIRTQILWLCVSNNPGLIDPAILARTPTPIYLGRPDSESMIGLIKERLPCGDAEQVNDELGTLLLNYECSSTVKALQTGLNFLELLNHICEGKLDGCNATAAATTIFGGGSFPAAKELRDYEQGNRALIRRAGIVQGHYLDRGDAPR